MKVLSKEFPADWNRDEIYPMDMGGVTIHVKLDNV